MAIVAGLAVVELWIVDLMIQSLSCGASAGSAAAASQAPVSAAGASSGAFTSGLSGHSVRTFTTGRAPHVVIDDDGATLGVTVRPGTTVDVSEETQASGWVQGQGGRATIERTSDGLRIVRSGPGLVVSLGLVRRRLDVVVPPETQLEVKNAGSMSITGLRADARLHSDDGSITVADMRGNVTVKTDDGRIDLDDVAGSTIDCNSDNGRITLDRVDADAVTITSDDGRIDATRSRLSSGKIQTSNGRIRLVLDPRSDVTIRAQTSSGKVIAQAPLTAQASSNGSDDDDDDAPSTIRVGSGAGHLEVGSDDGSITIAAQGVGER
jgi:hypothetical protein